MLTQIHIHDLATIEKVELNLQRGATMITGETGAGKSIFIEAIELALGGRASANMVRPGKDKAEITLCFDISSFAKVNSYLKNLDLYDDNNECIIRRVITADGRSRCYVNGSPSTLQNIKELGELLFHLHSQHEQQVLLRADTQREMLDRYGDHMQLANEVREIAEQIRDLNQEIADLQTKTATRNEHAAYLRFQLDELTTLNLAKDEWQTLEVKHHRLTHAEELIKNTQSAISLLADDDNNALSSLHHIRKLLEAIHAMEPKAKEWLKSLDSSIIQLEDIASEFTNYLDNTQLDPNELQKIEERVSAIFNLARKHKIKPEELTTLQESISKELAELNSSDETIKLLQAKLTLLEKNYHENASLLSNKRKSAGHKLENIITQTMRSLSLPHCEFKILLETEQHIFSMHGKDKINYVIKTNPDQNMQSLHKVISGGELSRLSLALHLALANRTNIPTLVFDEVDTGLSGATAEKIGKLLRKLGDSYQVFCVTHQPQVAACGHQHLLVEKYFINKVTHTRLRLLESHEKESEIARMLGGEIITATTLKHAKEVLSSV